MDKFFNLTAGKGETGIRLMVRADEFEKYLEKGGIYVIFAKGITPVDQYSDSNWSDHIIIDSVGKKHSISCREGFDLELSVAENFVGCLKLNTMGSHHSQIPSGGCLPIYRCLTCKHEFHDVWPPQCPMCGCEDCEQIS